MHRGPEVSVPTAVVGMVGGGQLARMTQQAAIGLGIELQVLTAHDWDPAVLAGARFVPGDPDDLEALLALAKGSDVVTFDHEHVPNAHLRALVDAGYVVRPGPAAKLLAQDKSIARQVLGDAGVAIPAFVDAAPEFGSHLGAVPDWPLGAPTLVAPAAATVNLLGPPEPVDLTRTVKRALE